MRSASLPAISRSLSRSNRLPRRWSKWRNAVWLPAALLIFVQFASGLREMPQMTFFLLYLQEQFGLPPVAISGIVAGAQLTGMLTALLGGAVAARLGSKWVLVTGLFCSGVSSFAFQAPWLWLVVLLWMFSGAGVALTSVGGASTLTRISAREALGSLASFYALSVTVGGALGNPTAAVLIEQSGFAAFSWFAITVSAVAILVITFLMPNYQDRAPAPVSVRALWSGMLAIARQTNVRLVVAMRCLATIFYGMLVVLIPLMLNNLTGSKVLVAAYGTTNLVVASAAQLLTGRVADRRGARLPTLVAYSAMILAGLGLAASAGMVWGLFAFGVLGIAAAWSLATLMYVWVSDGVARADHPPTFGLLHAVWSLSMITGSVLGGWFVATLPGLPFLLAGLLNVGSLFLTVAYYRRNTVRPI
jgi:MFS transporter, AAHS family, 3-hydroxyphenylpropionic acid transporter